MGHNVHVDATSNDNSPVTINTTVNITVNVTDEEYADPSKIASLIHKIGEYFGKGTNRTIEIPVDISEGELCRMLARVVEDG